MRSLAFSCLAGLSSCLASEWYSSMVFWKAVREALREPRAAGLRMLLLGLGEEEGVVESEGALLERLARSLRMAVLCLRALLKVVFCDARVSQSVSTWRLWWFVFLLFARGRGLP